MEAAENGIAVDPFSGRGYAVAAMCALEMGDTDLIPAVSVPVSAAPSSGNVVQQMGGPVSSKFSLNIDDIIKNYASSRAYEARFYPFGEGEGMPVFVGTAHRVKDISKTDAQIA